MYQSFQFQTKIFKNQKRKFRKIFYQAKFQTKVFHIEKPIHAKTGDFGMGTL